MAAPHVSGLAALILSIDSSSRPETVEAFLKGFSKKRTTDQCPKKCGVGLLNANFLVP